MRKIVLVLCILMSSYQLSAQKNPVAKGNYQLAARFSPTKLNKLVFSTAVDPHWLKKSDRFWYTYETPAGRKWYIVDPAKASKQEMFDNAKLASMLTMMVKDPFDAQHMSIENLKFIKDENTIQFEIKSSVEIEKKDSTKKPPVTTKEKKTYYFEYNLLTSALTELKEYEKPKTRPIWASISPDRKTVIFSKNNNLYWMDSANYVKALKNDEDSTIVENKLTTDGVDYYSFGGEGFGDTTVDKEKNKN
ncbi:MAG: hypothetical protein H7Y31_11975 [Chitinophagaceae bacterium]|nr:hypothetical protein [Chitinophagaceae bacterium]